MKYYKCTQCVAQNARFYIEKCKNFPQTPPNNEEGDTPFSNSSPQCREGSNFLSFIPPYQRILDPSLIRVNVAGFRRRMLHYYLALSSIVRAVTKQTSGRRWCCSYLDHVVRKCFGTIWYYDGAGWTEYPRW